MQLPTFPVQDASAIETVLDALQTQAVKIPAREEVRRYLSLYPELTPLLEQAVCSLRAQFPAALLTLETYQDPEIEEENFLILLTQLDSYPADFWRVFDQVRRGVLASAPQLSAHLHITTDFGHG